MATSPDPQKVAVAKAIAAGGSKAPAAYKAAQADLNGQKSAVVEAATQRAGLINAPEDFLQQQAAQIAEPFTTAGTKNNANASALNSYMGSMNNAQGNYLAGVASSAPLVQQEVNQAAQGANISQLMQMFNLKNSMEDREYEKSRRAASLDSQQSELTTQAQQRKALSDIASNYGLTAQELALATGAQDYNTALASLGDEDTQKDWKKRGIDVDALSNALLQYYDPELFSAMSVAKASKPAQAETASQTPVTPPAPSNYQKSKGNFLQSLSKGLSSPFKF